MNDAIRPGIGTNRAHAWTFALTALALATIALPAPGAAQNPAQDADRIAEGARLYGETCARCHNLRSPTERSDRAWRTIILHMRTRANLSASDAEAIQAFLQATNRDEGQTSTRDGRTDRDELARRDATAWRLENLGLLADSPLAPDSPVARQLADYVEKLRSSSAPER